MTNYSKEWVLWKVYESDKWVYHRCIAFTIADVWKKQIGYKRWYYDGYIYTFSFYYFGFSLYEREEEKERQDFDFN